MPLSVRLHTIAMVELLLTAALLPAASAQDGQDTEGRLRVTHQPDRLVISDGETPLATYVFRDEHVLRPYFANVHAPNKLLVTRHYPPRAGIDSVDHALMHPGIWLAFGDINGHDFWRNKGRIAHSRFVSPAEVKSESGASVVTFAVENHYVTADPTKKTICTELARHTIRAEGKCYLLTFDSAYSSNEPFVFGDQEEMGLGIRVAETMTVGSGNGEIENSAGDRNGKDVWGKQADWCVYRGVFPGQSTAEPTKPSSSRLRAGLLLVPHPENFRRSWMHARDYGLVVANPFGQRAFTKGLASKVEVEPGKVLRLRFGIWIFAAEEDEKVDLDAMAAQYVRYANAR